MIQVPCYFCGSTSHEPYAHENGFHLVKCLECGLLYVTPRPDDAEVQTTTALGVHPGDHALDMRGGFTRHKYHSYLRVLPEMYGEALCQRRWRWLDVGCGYGELLIALARIGRGNVAAKGLEPMAAKRAAARSRGLDVEAFDLETHTEAYDCVSLLNVYSHLTHPPKFFDMLRKRLRPGGEVLIQTGDNADLRPAEQEKPYYLPSHLSFANERILTSILERCGYRVTAVRKFPAYSTAWILNRAARGLLKALLPRRRANLGEVASMYRISRLRPTDMYVRAAIA
jgi:2-polyprenyl-3-methyl-5-hydroxy-6-metoxy-1,4-benzoquinol methylase